MRRAAELSNNQAHRAHGRAWLLLCLLLAAHVFEEATTGFIEVFYPLLERLRERFGIPIPTPPRFEVWLAILIVVVSLLITLTPLVYRGARWLRTGSYVFAGLMIANGVNHLVSPIYLGRFLPGHYTSPLLIAGSIWLIAKARRGFETVS